MSRLRQSSRGKIMMAWARVVATDNCMSSEKEKIKMFEMSRVCTRRVTAAPLLLGQNWK